MTAFIALITVLLGALVWLYQKTWERQERKIQIYQAILEKLPAFTVGKSDPEGRDLALTEMRRLWLYAPDKIVQKVDEFLVLLESGGEAESNEKAQRRERMLKELIIALRKDATFCANIIPRCKTNLDPDVFKIRTAHKT